MTSPRPLAFLALTALFACGGTTTAGVPDPADGAPRSGGEGGVPTPPGPVPVTDGGGADGGDGGARGAASLRDNRDRLIDTLARQKGTTRCPLWAALTPTQKGVFLTITDLLGKRSFLTNDPGGGTPRAGRDLETALDHTEHLYELRDKGSFGNGGGDNNRMWLRADAALIAALRDLDGALPEWGKSTDLAGAHAPFDATSETAFGQPRGQAHFWSADAKSKPLGRPGVETVDDPRVVEIDIDYNLIHDSNPEGTYIPGGYGRTFYESKWTPKGVGGSAELDYVPTTCPR